jgi:hypothetical protein
VAERRTDDPGSLGRRAPDASCSHTTFDWRERFAMSKPRSPRRWGVRPFFDGGCSLWLGPSANSDRHSSYSSLPTGGSMTKLALFALVMCRCRDQRVRGFRPD